MKKSHRFIVVAMLLGAYLLSACSGAAPQLDDSQSPSGQFTEVVFTGAVESMSDGEWIVSGQQVSVDGASVDANIQVGDIVRVEASVSDDGAVLAVKIESSGADDSAGANDNSANDNSSNTNDDNANSNDANSNDDNSNGNDNSNDNGNDNSNDAAGTEQEVSGLVQAIGDGTITIDGVTYTLTTTTEFKDVIAVGDQVKIHVTVNADGTLAIREIERVGGTGIGDDNGNSNDDNSNGNDDSNANSNDNDSNGNSNDDGNSNGDDDNSNDDSNSNGNG